MIERLWASNRAGRSSTPKVASVATANRDSQQVTVEGDSGPDALIAAVEDAGYEATA